MKLKYSSVPSTALPVFGNYAKLLTVVCALAFVGMPDDLQAQRGKLKRGKPGTGGGGDAPSTAYTVEAIQLPGTPSISLARDLNLQGQIVGWVAFQDGTGDKLGFFRENDGSMSILPSLPGHAFSVATGISDSASIIIGGSSDPDTGAKASVWWEWSGDGYEAVDWNTVVPEDWGFHLELSVLISDNGRFINFDARDEDGMFGSLICEILYDGSEVSGIAAIDFIPGRLASGIHYNGETDVLRVVGFQPCLGGFGGFYWEKHGQGQATFDQGMGWKVHSVNASGEASGYEYDGITFTPYFWDKHGVRYGIGNLGGGSATATKINDLGYVVGSSKTRKINGQQRNHAFLWHQNMGMVDINSRVSFPGRYVSSCVGFNNAGQILAVTAPETSGGTVLHVLLTPPAK